MRIFLTGATGYIGNALALELRHRGHDVAALVRPESDSKSLRNAGVVLVAGDLASLPSLSGTLGGYDAFIHTAFSMTANGAELDRNAIDTFTATNAHFIYTSGVWVMGNATNADETTPPNPIAIVTWRVGHEQRVLASGRNAVLRPGCVYGGKQSLLADWFAAAEQNRPLRIVGDGANRWAFVDLHDLVDCYARLVESRKSGIFHAVDDTRATLNECAHAVAPNGAIEHVPADAARANLGPFADALLLDQQVGSQQTRRALGWSPQREFVRSVAEQWLEWRSALQKSE